ncbi:MAG: asparagine synthase (glutamine-hydrolyzing) [Desulfovibrionaceae bacterium]
MCGIAGYMGLRHIPEETARNCLRRMRHRGPDGNGLYRHISAAGQHVLLLHTRLAIVDLDERAAQPMRFQDKVLAFNGELYNFLEMRDILEKQGERFVGTGDTEVLLRQLARKGVEGLDACEGMWAVALYDEADGSLLLCRDRFGEKTLYLLRDDTGLYFGSEIKFLAALYPGKLRPDYGQLSRYLVNGYKTLYKQSATFFEGVTEVPRATVLRVGPDLQEQATHYWTLRTDQEPDMSFAEAAEGVRRLLLRAVEIRLRSDVPLAFCMSGGVDSNSLISIASNVFGQDVHGFTVVNTDERYAEQHLVDLAVAEQGLQHTNVHLSTRDFLPRMAALVRQHDGPVVTISYYVQWLLLREMAARGFKVSISGTGADELFTGYYDHYLMYLAAIRNTPQHAQAVADWQRHVAPVVRNPLLKDPEAFVNAPDMRGHITLGAELFAKRLRREFQESFAEERYAPELLRSRMLNELLHEVVPVILREDDLNAMSVSIENRSPFLDRALAEYCQTIPTRHLMRDGYSKAVLREAMCGLVPDAILNERRKVGFNAPVLDLLDTTDPMVREELLTPGPVYDLVRPEAVRELLEQRSLSNSESKFLYSVVNVKFFLDMLEG